MTKNEFIENLLLLHSRTIPQWTLKTTINSILSIIPEEIIEKGFESFSRSYIKEDKPIIEIALLTKDNIIHDFTNTPEKFITCAMKLTSTIMISIYTYYSSEVQTQLNDEDKPYRADLEIADGAKSLSYTAEGDRRGVNSLIKFGQDCLLAFYKL